MASLRSRLCAGTNEGSTHVVERIAKLYGITLSDISECLVLGNMKRPEWLAAIQQLDILDLFGAGDAFIARPNQIWLFLSRSDRIRTRRVGIIEKITSKYVDVSVVYSGMLSRTPNELCQSVAICQFLSSIEQPDSPRVICEHDGLAQILHSTTLEQYDKHRIIKRLLWPVFDNRVLSRTAQTMLQANLSTTRAAKLLKVHRNTLLYRLGKIKKLSGLDLTHFEDAKQYFLCLWAEQALK